MRLFFLIGMLSLGFAFGQKEATSVLMETSERIEIHKAGITELYHEAKGSAAWEYLAAINAIEKRQFEMLSVAYGIQCGLSNKDALQNVIKGAKDEIRGYLIVAKARRQIEGVLDALEYADREMVKL
jgi:hypothetical protein